MSTDQGDGFSAYMIEHGVIPAMAADPTILAANAIMEEMPFVESTSPTLTYKKDNAMLGGSGFERNERDLYPTIDLDVTHALCRTLLGKRFISPGATIWEPACGDWTMGKVLDDYFRNVIGSDIEPMCANGIQADFLNSTIKAPFDAIITNPPFGDAIDAFMLRGLHHLRKGNCKLVAFLGRNEIDSAVTRGQFFGACPEYAAKIVLTWRPRWVKDSKGSPRHNYSWFVWTDASARIAAGGPQIFYAHRR